MTEPEAIRTALERVVKAVTIRPAVGQGTAITRVHKRAGLTAEVEEGPWRFQVGMSDKYGGDNSAPNPGVFGRAAVGSCMAIGYGMWAARLGVPIESLTVEVHATYDVRGELGVDEAVPPGYTDMKYVVIVESSASEEEVLRMLDTADRFSSWRDNMMRGVPLHRELHLNVARP